RRGGLRRRIAGDGAAPGGLARRRPAAAARQAVLRGEQTGLERPRQGRAGVAAGLSDIPGGPAGGVGGRGRVQPTSSTAAIRRVMSCGRERRWSPSFIRVKTTSP